MKKDNLLHFPLVKRVGKIEAMMRFRMLNQEKILANDVCKQIFTTIKKVLV